ncbi:hypothetical protein PABG_11613 [Paracoccidioides brasiliensis Pb03]|uniref:Uncharacterized protein n=2 Tax=Paracoccidioides brasiliensis TaxID=121759 RepID=A0A0A0HYH0_PARBD|nr:uncharacterized protein PADG_11235 [Paracoccidioides brasiliensis Pb18]KGM92420.1 hypothetical protein PADG_11235 [Paracoccidioides brasiliensis Pb18]KGY15314.1 hypothetical protein PABG_11613 [Paracoccidioides brasiliensis Pb03]ODH25996.1 hypothetical protein ACO22_04886 [Paracoccidioides brasiliensis]
MGMQEKMEIMDQLTDRTGISLSQFCSPLEIFVRAVVGSSTSKKVVSSNERIYILNNVDEEIALSDSQASRKQGQEAQTQLQFLQTPWEK